MNHGAGCLGCMICFVAPPKNLAALVRFRATPENRRPVSFTGATESSGHSADIDGLRQFLLKFRPPCRRLPESVRISAGIREQSVPPACSLAGFRTRAIGHAEVLEVAGSLGAVADGLAAPTRYRSLP